ncbi:hypothetical protein [Breznakia pachnodae]|uniref:Uncharacterized protein n=1 Tax=Breznakia pachnodae TaxID=265178 RepID=A0ABU0E6S0_9FIRM|nr:hypothetical protein [Breznakia pachnodae]MDQ0362505.1 hypothetical protein [Breznakia pachnodae]
MKKDKADIEYSLTHRELKRLELEEKIKLLEPINYDSFTEADLRFVIKCYLESRNIKGARYKSIKTKDLLSTLKLMHLNKITLEFFWEDITGERKKSRQMLVRAIRPLFSQKEFDDWFMFIGNFESIELMLEWLDLDS